MTWFTEKNHLYYNITGNKKIQGDVIWTTKNKSKEELSLYSMTKSLKSKVNKSLSSMLILPK